MTTDIKPPAPKPIMRFVGSRFYRNLHRGVFRMTRGRVAGRINGIETVLLTTTGRKTGKKRTVPLLYLEDGDALVVVARADGA